MCSCIYLCVAATSERDTLKKRLEASATSLGLNADEASWKASAAALKALQATSQALQADVEKLEKNVKASDKLVFDLTKVRQELF